MTDPSDRSPEAHRLRMEIGGTTESVMVIARKRRSSTRVLWGRSENMTDWEIMELPDLGNIFNVGALGEQVPYQYFNQ